MLKEILVYDWSLKYNTQQKIKLAKIRHNIQFILGPMDIYAINNSLDFGFRDRIKITQFYKGIQEHSYSFVFNNALMLLLSV